MASSEFDNEDSKVDGTQEAVLPTNDAPIPLPNGAIWDPVTKSYTRRTQDDQPDRFQVPGTPSVDQDYSMKTKNPELSGVFARTAAVRYVRFNNDEDDWGVYSDRARGPYNTPLVFRGTFDECRAWVRENGHTASFAPEPPDEATGYRQCAQEFWDMAESETNPVRQRQYYVKADYYNRLADKYAPQAKDPATTQADNGAPAAADATDVYMDRTPKHDLQGHDDSFPGMISSRIPKVTSTMLNTGRNSYQEPDAPNLRDCPEAGCGGKMQDTNDESHCHDCGHKEKVHYAAVLAPLAIGAEALEGAAAVGAGAEAAGAAGGVASTGMSLGTGLRAANLMTRVMGGGQQQQQGDSMGAMPEVGSGGSAEADDSMARSSSSVADEEGLYSYDNDGEDSNPSAGNKGSEGQDKSAPELDSSTDTDTGGSASLRGMDLFEVLEPYLLSIADNDDSHEDPIAKALHELLLADDPEYMTKTANATCPTCKIDLGSGASTCGSPDASVACPVNLPKANANAVMQTGQVGQMPPAFAQPMARVAADLYDQDEFNQPPVPSAEYRLSQYDKNQFDPADGSIYYVAASGSPWQVSWTDDDPGKLTLVLGDMNYHTLSLDYLRSNGPEYTASIYDETGAAADMTQIFDATLRLHPGAGSGAGAFEAHTAARRPKMCPVHEQLVNYALLFQNAEAALGAFSGALFGEHSCQGGYEMVNKAGNPTKCRFKPEMVTQSYWDDKDAQAEAKQLEREQQELEQQQMLQQQMNPQPVLEEEPEGQLIGGPEYEAQQEQQAVEEKAPVTQEIPGLDPIQSEQDYMPAEQGADDFEQQFAIAASYKWSGPPALEAPEKMFTDTPPEEEIAPGISSDDPTDMEGNPLKVGMTYEVHSPNNKGYVPDRYVITAVDPSLIQFEVESQKELGQPFAFTSTLSTKQIAAEGIEFRPTDDANPNARGDVEPTDSDNTKGSDVPGQVSDLDTGGNSKATSSVKTADQYEDMRDFQRSEQWDGPGEYVPPTRAYTQGDIDEMYPEGMTDENLESFNHLMEKDMQRYDQGMARNRDAEVAHLQDQIRELKARLGEEHDDDDFGFEDDPMRYESRTAGRDYSVGEQRGFVNESGSARNLDKLDLSGTHYPTASDDDPYADFLW